MVGPIGKKYIYKGITLGSLVLSMPFILDQEKRPQVTRVKWRLFGWWLNIIITVLYTLLIFVRTLKLTFADPLQKDYIKYPGWYLPFMYANLLMWFWATSLQIAHVLLKDELLNFAETYVKYFDEIQEQDKSLNPAPSTAGKRKSLKWQMMNDKFGVLMACLYYSCYPIPTCLLFVCILIPDIPIYVIQLDLGIQISQATILEWLIIIFNIILFEYGTVTMFTNIFLYVLIALPYSFDVPRLLEEMVQQAIQSKEFQKKKGKQFRRSLAFYIRRYRELEIVHKKFQRIYCTIIIPAINWLLVFLVSTCLYCAIRGNGFIFVSCSNAVGLLLTYLGVSFTIYGRFYEYSSNLLDVWRGNSPDPRSEKWLNAARPLKITIGSYYFVDKGMVLTMFQSIVETTVDLLVANSL